MGGDGQGAETSESDESAVPYTMNGRPKKDLCLLGGTPIFAMTSATSDLSHTLPASN